MPFLELTAKLVGTGGSNWYNHAASLHMMAALAEKAGVKFRRDLSGYSYIHMFYAELGLTGFKLFELLDEARPKLNGQKGFSP